MKNIYFKKYFSNISRLFTIILFIFNANFFIQIKLHANEKEIKEFNYNIMGKTIRNEEILFLSGSRFVSFKHEGGFNTNIGRYGVYYCSGSIFYNKKGALENMTYACEFSDQMKERFYSKGNRIKGSQSDRSIGKMKIYEGEGFWKDYVGFNCTYGLEYVENIVFVSAKCR